MRVIPIATLMVISTCRAWAANAPSRLYGKTISVSSTENLMWRPAGAQVFTHREKTSHLIVYVSGSGSLFVRIVGPAWWLGSHGLRAGRRARAAPISAALEQLSSRDDRW